MLSLVIDISDNCIELWMCIRKCAESFLPFKASGNKAFLIDKSGRTWFDFPQQPGYWYGRFQANKNVAMIRHCINGNRLRPQIGDYAAYIFPDFLCMSIKYQILPGSNRKNSMDIKLCIGIGQNCWSPLKIMPVLRTSYFFWINIFYKHAVPLALNAKYPLYR